MTAPPVRQPPDLPSLLAAGPVPVVLNAGSRLAGRAVRAVRAGLASRGVDADVRVVRGGLTSALDDLAGAPVAVVGGGDGTVAAAAGRLDVDLGRAESSVEPGRDHTFLNVASIGLSAAVTEHLSPGLKRRLGPAAYAVATVRAYRAHEPFDARLEFPGGDHEAFDLTDVVQLSVGNGRHYGGGNTVAPDASVDDGTLDVYAVVHAPLREHARLVRRLRDGTLVHHSRVVHLTTPAVRVSTSRPLPLNLDGEVGPATPVTVSTDPDAVEVILPTHSRAAAYDGRRRLRRHLD